MPQIALQIATDHPSFAGHFPGRPIVPGVVLLDRAQRVIESAHALTLKSVSVAKFHNPAAPGDELILDYHIDSNAVRFVIRSGERKIADGRFVVEEKNSAEEKNIVEEKFAAEAELPAQEKLNAS